MRLLCDEMLRGVARWLRAAGHDAAIVEPAACDEAVLRQARAERRILLTCDRRLAGEAPAGVAVVLLESEAPNLVAGHLRERLGLDWLHRPFSRCLVDNAVLGPVPASGRAHLPERARAGPGPILACPACGRLYWPGSHVRRMRARLQQWQENGSGPQP